MVDTKPSDSFDQTRTISVELYKSLRAEGASYLEKVPALWLQKFTLLGAMIAFILMRHKELRAEEGAGNTLVIAAVLAIPVLAVNLSTLRFLSTVCTLARSPDSCGVTPRPTPSRPHGKDSCGATKAIPMTWVWSGSVVQLPSSSRQFRRLY